MNQPAERPPPCELTDDPEIIVDLARSVSDRGRLLREVEGRQWARNIGIHGPTVVAVGPDGAWLASARLRPTPSTQAAFIDASLHVTDLLHRADPPDWSSRGEDWRAPARTRLVRAAQLVLAGVDPIEFARVRRSAEILPAVVPVHGDYHPANIIDTTATDATVNIVDWEYAVTGPRYHDALRFAGTLDDEADMRSVWDRIASAAPRAGRRSPRRRALRTYAGEVTARRAEREPAAMIRYRQRCARDWAEELERGMR